MGKGQTLKKKPVYSVRLASFVFVGCYQASGFFASSGFSFL
nr:MAG TPA: hypothetical protein [Caudoviricetes sp.]